MLGKAMDLAAKRSPAKVWTDTVRVRPGGTRGGRMLRFAEADTDFGNLHSEYCIRLCAFNTALATRAGRIQTLRAFRRARLRSTSNENRRTKIEQDKTGCSGEAVF